MAIKISQNLEQLLLEKSIYDILADLWYFPVVPKYSVFKFLKAKSIQKVDIIPYNNEITVYKSYTRSLYNLSSSRAHFKEF